MVAGVADGVADADPEPAELFRSELIDDRAQAVVAAMAARLPKAQLPERQREVVGHDEQVTERRVLARQHLADGEARVVHPGQRLDEGQVEAVVSTHGDVGCVALPATARPPGALREPVEHEPSDVMTRAGIALTRIAKPDDDLQRFSRWPSGPRTARCGPNPGRSGRLGGTPASWEGLPTMVPGTAPRRGMRGPPHRPFA